MFTFKQFVIHQDRTAMKVGTDGVLLGAWAPLSPESQRTLDLGTGTGLIALMLAQRYPLHHIDAIDIDPSAISQAADNISGSPFSSQVRAFHVSLQDYTPEFQYDSIVSNPPYFNNSLQCPDRQRSTARHTDTLSFDDLLCHSSRLLRIGGTLSLILPIAEAQQLISTAKRYNYHLLQVVYVHPTPGSDSKRLMLHFIKTETSSTQLLPFHESHLTIELSRHVYTPEYIDLTRDFYLKM